MGSKKTSPAESAKSTPSKTAAKSATSETGESSAAREDEASATPDAEGDEDQGLLTWLTGDNLIWILLAIGVTIILLFVCCCSSQSRQPRGPPPVYDLESGMRGSCYSRSGGVPTDHPLSRHRSRTS